MATSWTAGRRFAFTVFDDTDGATLQNVRPVYDLLADLGLWTTKSVWPVDVRARGAIGGETCAEPQYRAWVQWLQEVGFEVGLHGVSNATATRAETRDGLTVFQ